MSLYSIIIVSVIGGFLLLILAIYGIMWYFAYRYKKKNNIHSQKYINQKLKEEDEFKLEK